MKTLYVYLHTHWDREWYEPFESFRSKLVDTVRSITTGLDSGELPNFYLDGQSSVLLDATDIDPRLKEQIRRLMSEKRLSAGPWYVLADQMLVGGESLVRNLQCGLESTREFGEPSMVGYCPDTFGHTQDLPRILSGFGIQNAVVWRGVPAHIEEPAFWWESPDGSRVLCYCLTRGYYQTALHEQRSPEELGDYLLPWIDGQQQALFPAGGDHLAPPVMPERKLSAVRSYWASKGMEAELLPVSLSQFLTRLSQSTANGALQTVKGELRDNAAALQRERAYMLQGVLSSRLYLKRENRQAEHRLIAVMEPLLTILNIERRLEYPEFELRHAWKHLLQNHPHDSICGCSVDAVHDQMMTRFAGMNQLLDAIETKIRAVVAKDNGSPSSLSPKDPEYPHNRLLMYNLSAEEQSGPVRISWTEHADGAKKLRDHSNCQVISRRQGTELFTEGGVVPYYKEAVVVDGWVYCDSVPACGMKESTWPMPVSREPSKRVQVDPQSIRNEFFTVTIDSHGELAVVAGERKYRLVHRLQDLADCGDTYNFDPIVNDVPIKAHFKKAKVGQKGPLVASLLLTYEINLPLSAEEKRDSASGEQAFIRSNKKAKHQVTTEISLRKGVPILFFDTVWRNEAADHRLEVIFDTSAKVEKTWSENHFSVVERKHNNPPVVSLPVPAGTEAPLDRFPCQRFFIANDQVFLNAGLPEYAVDGESVSITLLRAVSLLSREKLLTRGGGAGPYLPTPGANCLGTNRTTYGWAPLGPGSDHDQQVIEAYRMAEQFEGRLWTSLAFRDVKERSTSFVKLDNQAIRLVSLHTVGGSRDIVLRLLNVTSKPQQARLRTAFPCRDASLCNLNGDVCKVLFSSHNDSAPPGAMLLPLDLQENELITLKLSMLSS